MNRYAMDDIDEAIVGLLREDGRMTFTRIGDTVGLSTDAVRVRVNRMTSDGVLRVMGLVSPEALGYHTVGSLLLGVRGRLQPVIRTLTEHPNVSFLAQLIGDRNLFCGLVARNDTELATVVDDLVVQHGTIQDAELVRTLDVVKWFDLPGARTPRPAPDPASLDEIDTALLHRLVENPRASYRELEASLDQPYWIVRAKTKRLFHEDHIRATATVDRVSTIPDIQALLRLKMRGDVGSGLDRIAAIPQVRLLVLNAGSEWLVSGEVICTDGYELANLLEELLSIPSVVDVRNFVYSHVHRLSTPFRYGINLRRNVQGERVRSTM
ncbi:hypothetical protein GCM10009613_05300 [Pseudonocardia kongjuensis]|uniref:HTH asnC-type domain-containing protein n=1 Tax=Pseudonocardia kongjuensis TaxID=102227 RepID=A0ABP4IAF0_9PSEU